MKAKIIHTKRAFAGRILDVIHQKVRLPKNGMLQFELVKRRPAVLIVPLTAPDKVLMTWQYRAALNRSILEFPGGGINPGETLEHAACRELLEECGCLAKKIEHAGRFVTAPHFCDETYDVVFATELSFHKKQPTEREVLTNRFVLIKRLFSMADAGLICDMRTIVATGILKKRLQTL
jgi:ADP-ribose pyrophosphatase